MRSRGYSPQEYIDRSPILKEILNLVQSNFLSPVEFGLFDGIVRPLTNTDYFFVWADLSGYYDTQQFVSKTYQDKAEWTKRSITNVAKSGKFSADRTIKE